MPSVPVGGHTAHHQMVVVQDGRDTVVVPTDVLPTASLRPLPYIASYDLFPVGTLEAKRRLVSESWTTAGAGGSSTMTLCTPLGRVREQGGRYFLMEDAG